ncbi:MAG TPA: hypothetical protein VMZ28_07485 [Kofleriaceae bacterium]|nr:hypothetical protein [Kofleriaceae bacterium]
MAKAKNGKKGGGAAKKGGEMLLVGSKVKAEIKSANCNTAGDALDGLNGWVHWLITQATQRASANGRKTVRAHDFMV